MYITVDVFYYMTGHYICQLKIQKNFVYNPQSKSPLYLLQYFSYLYYICIICSIHIYICTYFAYHDTILTI